MGRSVLIASGKGGSGKTTIAIGIAMSLARRDYKVCLVDLNFGLRNLDIYLGLENRVLFDIGDIMSGVCKVRKALVHAPEYGDLWLLESTQNKLINGITESHIKALIKQLKEDFDYVIIDGPTAIGNDLKLAACGADCAALVMTPDSLSLRNSDSVDKRLEACGITSRCFILNLVKHSLQTDDFGPSMQDILNTMTMPLAGIVPYDENIELGNNAGRPVFGESESYISKNMDEIVYRMIG